MTVLKFQHFAPSTLLRGTAEEKPGLLPTPPLRFACGAPTAWLESPPPPPPEDPLEAKGVVCIDHDYFEEPLRTVLVPTKMKIKSSVVIAHIKNSFVEFNPVDDDSLQAPVPRTASCPDLSKLEYEPIIPSQFSDVEKTQTGITTYMIRNIPTRFSSITFVRLLEDYGFGNTFNFFYLPMDFRSGKNMGYAFINFVDPAMGTKFVSRFDQRRLPVTTSKKVLEISPSRRQGLNENIALFRTSDLLNSVSLPHYKPLISTEQTGGQLLPLTETNFPPIRK